MKDQGAENISDPSLFQQVFKRYAPELRNFLYYKCGDLAQAEDLMQETFLRLWKKRDSVSPKKAKSYLFTVANNLFLDEMKHRQVVLKFQKRPQKFATFEDPLFQIETEEFKQRLEKAISDLPEKSRIVFLMSRIDKLSYQEISERLDISVKAVEKRMHKALVALRKITQKI